MTTETTPTTTEPVAPVTPAAPVVEPVTPAAKDTPPAVTTAPVVETPATPAAPKVETPAPVKVEGAPEKYADFAVPEGAVLEAEVSTAFSDVAKELNLPQDKAQKVIDKMLPVLNQRATAATAQVKSDLLAASHADAEIGGDKFDYSVASAKVTMEACFTPAFNKFLDESGLGNHPEMIRGLAKASAAFKPDGWTPGGKQPQQANNGAQSFYNKSNMAP